VSLQIVLFTASQDHMTEAEQGIGRLFAAANPLLTIPEAAASRQDMPRWAVTPPAPEPMTVLGDYRMLG
jgi:hypothetical protein